MLWRVYHPGVFTNRLPQPQYGMHRFFFFTENV